MPFVNLSSETTLRNTSSRLANLKLPGAADIETLEPESAGSGIGKYLIEIVVLLHAIPLAYGLFVVIRANLQATELDTRYLYMRRLAEFCRQLKILSSACSTRRDTRQSANILGRWAEVGVWLRVFRFLEQLVL